jgi:DNA-binding response OmpR family regulator
MDEMSGVEFLRELRTTPQHTETPVIFVSALGAVPQVEEAITLGATDYLVKPVSFRKLRRTVESALRTGTGTLPPVRYEIEA